MEVIIPAAGLSTRFPNMRPKYTLTDHTGTLMLERSISSFLGKYKITIGILKEHEEKYNIIKTLNHEIPELNIVVLDERTNGPAETVSKIIEQAGIDINEGILIKDCDSFFEHDVSDGNYVCISTIAEHEILKRLASKSFVITNDQGIITNIIEKEVISNKFCVGGYKFESAKLFCETYEKLKDKNVGEIFVSHIIEECLNNHRIFLEKHVSNYVDVGTADEWFAYNNKACIFCDIDGTIIRAQPKGGYDDEPVILKHNVERLKELVANGSKIIFTTARHTEYDTRTKEILDSLGFVNYDLISGLPNTKRVLINDYNEANPYPRAIAVNLKRNADNLGDYI
jgi:histidinol phosphatase-like enzyme